MKIYIFFLDNIKILMININLIKLINFYFCPINLFIKI